MATALTRLSERSRGWRGVSLMTIGVLLIGWLFVLPLAMLGYGMLRSSPFPPAVWTLDGLSRVLGRVFIWRVLGVTLAYSLGVAVLGVALALGLLLVSTRSQAPLRRLLTPSMVVLLAVPKSFYALAWAMLGAGSGGLVNKGFALVGASGLAHAFSTQNWFGVVLVSALKTSSIAYLLLIGPVRSSGASGVEAARVCGASAVGAFVRTQLPMLAPALLSTTIFGFVLTMQEFEVPAILGLGANIRVFSTAIYTYLQDPLGPDYPAASAASMILVALVMLCVIGQLGLLGDRSFVTVTARASHEPAAYRRGRRWWGTLVVLVWLAVAIALPLAQMVVGSFQSYFGVFAHWSAANYRAVLGDQATRSALLVTVVGSLVDALASVALSFALAYALARGRRRWAALARLASWVPATMPGLVFGLALLWVYAVVPGLRELFGTPAPLVLGLVVSVVPFAVRALEGSLAQVSDELEAAARVSGDGPLGAVGRITVPLVWPAVLAAWVLVAFVMSGALDVPLLLASTSANTVSTLSYSLFQNGSLSRAAALYCATLALFLLFAVLALTLRQAARGLHGRARGATAERHALAHEGVM